MHRYSGKNTIPNSSDNVIELEFNKDKNEIPKLQTNTLSFNVKINFNKYEQSEWCSQDDEAYHSHGYVHDMSTAKIKTELPIGSYESSTYGNYQKDGRSTSHCNYQSEYLNWVTYCKSKAIGSSSGSAKESNIYQCKFQKWVKDHKTKPNDFIKTETHSQHLDESSKTVLDTKDFSIPLINSSLQKCQNDWDDVPDINPNSLSFLHSSTTNTILESKCYHPYRVKGVSVKLEKLKHISSSVFVCSVCYETFESRTRLADHEMKHGCMSPQRNRDGWQDGVSVKLESSDVSTQESSSVLHRCIICNHTEDDINYSELERSHTHVLTLIRRYACHS